MGMDSSGMPGSALDKQPMMSRRGALRVGALGLGVVWVTPVLSVVSMESASAASGPPTSVRPTHPNQPRAQGVPLSRAQGSQGGELADTGASAGDAAVIGLGVVAAGAGAMGVAAAVKHRKTSASAPGEPQ